MSTIGKHLFASNFWHRKDESCKKDYLPVLVAIFIKSDLFIRLKGNIGNTFTVFLGKITNKKPLLNLIVLRS
jgi:hypothetical protein